MSRPVQRDEACTRYQPQGPATRAHVTGGRRQLLVMKRKLTDQNGKYRMKQSVLPLRRYSILRCMVKKLKKSCLRGCQRDSRHLESLARSFVPIYALFISRYLYQVPMLLTALLRHSLQCLSCRQWPAPPIIITAALFIARTAEGKPLGKGSQRAWGRKSKTYYTGSMPKRICQSFSSTHPTPKSSVNSVVAAHFNILS